MLLTQVCKQAITLILARQRSKWRLVLRHNVCVHRKRASLKPRTSKGMCTSFNTNRKLSAWEMLPRRILAKRWFPRFIRSRSTLEMHKSFGKRVWKTFLQRLFWISAFVWSLSTWRRKDECSEAHVTKPVKSQPYPSALQIFLHKVLQVGLSTCSRLGI